MAGIDETTRARLESARWRVGDAAEFLGLTPEEAAFVELKLALASYLREVRGARGWTQVEVAGLLGSSQSRVAKMEAADSTVSVDLLVRSLLRLGATREDVGRVIARAA
jgi:predicted XRE-type DNA-binding protein